MRFRQHAQAAQYSTRGLLVLFLVVLVLLVLAVNGVLALIYRLAIPITIGYPSYFFETNTALVLLFVLGGCWFETERLGEGGAHVARIAGGRPVQADGPGPTAPLERRFAHTVQEMALATRLPTPAAWVLPDDDSINAFAAGWSSDDAVVAVTRGSLERLTREELQGMVAHEFSHIAHGDTRLNMRLIGLVWGLQMLFGLGRTLLETQVEGRRTLAAPFGLGLMAVGALGWVAGRLLQAAVSRQREFLADASAVKYTRLVAGIGGALRKIATQAAQGAQGLHAPQSASLAHLLFAHRAGGWNALWQTHPPLSERVRRLYGRVLPDLPADVLPPPADDELPPLTAMARYDPKPGDAEAPGNTSEAQHHDATQIPSSFDAAAREHDALQRISRWHGPGEWQAAMLALAVAPDAVGAGARWAAWRDATADLGVAAAVRADIEALRPAARREVFALLIERAREAAPVQRAPLRRALQARWHALPTSPAQRLRALTLARGLQRRTPPGVRRPLADCAAEAHAATWQLASALGVDEAATQAWLQAARAGLTALDAPPVRSAAAGLAPAVTPSLMLALRLRQVTPMQRPLLARAWMQAAQVAGIADTVSVGDALHLACLWLDTVVPERLLAR